MAALLPIWGRMAPFVHSVSDHRRGGIKRNSGYLIGYQVWIHWNNTHTKQ